MTKYYIFNSLKQLLSITFLLLIGGITVNAQCTTGTGVTYAGTVTASASTCKGSPYTVTLSGANTTGTAEYMFVINANPTVGYFVWQSPIVSTPTYTFPPGVLNATGNYTVYACVRTVGYCGFLEPTHVNFTIYNELNGPDSISTTKDTICQNDATVVTAHSFSYGNIMWYDNPDGAGSSVGNYSSLSVNPTSDQAYYAFIYSSYYGCLSSKYLADTIIVKSASVPTCYVYGNSTTVNVPITLTEVSSISSWTYNWSFGSDATPQRAIGPSQSVSWSTPGYKVAAIVVVDSSTGCYNECQASIRVDYGCPKSKINAITGGCVSEALSIEADTNSHGPGISYAWSFSGGTPSSASGMGPHNVTWSTAGSKAVQLTVSKSGCASHDTTIYISIGTSYTNVISGPRALATGVAGTFSTSQVSGATYSWSIDGGSQTGTGYSVGINWPSVGTKIIGVTMNYSGCIKTDTHSVVISAGVCYNSKSDFSKYDANFDMNNVALTDSANTSVTYTINSTAGAFKLNDSISRSGDTSLFWRQNPSIGNNLVTMTFNIPVSDLSFSIRDLDRKGSYNSADSIYVQMYDASNNPIPFSALSTSLGSEVAISGSNTFYSNNSTFPYSTSNSANTADVLISISGRYVKYVTLNRLCIGAGFFGGAPADHDIAISQIEWCSSNPLPVSFFKLSANQIGDNSVKVNWSTAMEMNNDFFTIERSENGNGFKELAQISGVGNSNKINNYEFIDYTAPAGDLIYRIKQTDFDGAFDYSDNVHLILNSIAKQLIVYPNPAQNEVNVVSENLKANGGLLKVTTLEGRIIASIEVLKGEAVYSINTDTLEGGIYLIIEESNQISTTKKLVIQK